MAGLESLRFVLFLGDDRASSAFSSFARQVDQTTRAVDRNNFALGESKDKLDAIRRKSEELGRLHPDIKVNIDDAAAKLKLAVLKHELRSAGGMGGGIGGLGGAAGAGAAGFGALPGGVLPWLLGGAAVLSPPVIGAGLGLAGFAAVAIPSLMKISAALTSTGAAGKKAWAA